MEHDDAGVFSGVETTPVGTRPRDEDLGWLLDATRQRLFGNGTAPSTIGRYVVLSRLGIGGMGQVYEAFDRSLDRRVAIKVLRRDADAAKADRLVREAQALARLSHPNVVQVHEVGEFEGQAFIVMELVGGRTLRQWIKQVPRPNWRACIEVFLQAGAGLAAAHEQGLVHRDIKPSNVMIDERGRVCVVDFGLARTTGDPTNVSAASASAPVDLEEETTPSTSMVEQRLTQTGHVLGSPAYMSLEQMREEVVDHASDQFSFCVTLFEAVYGGRPFVGRSMSLLMKQIRDGEIHEPPARSQTPARLRTILHRGLSANPRERWPSMEALLSELRALLSPSRVRPAAVAIALGGLLTSAAVLADTDDAVCTGGPALLASVWDTSHREALSQQWGEVLLTEQVANELDRYVAAWLDGHRRACEATRVTQEQSVEVMDLRMACLAESRREFEGVVEALLRTDDRSSAPPQNVTEMLAELPPPTGCDALDQLADRRRRVPPPNDAWTASEVDRLRSLLARVRAEGRLGHAAEGLALLEPSMAEIESVDYPPLLAEAQLERGILSLDAGAFDDAEHHLQRAYEQALAHGDLELGVRATRSLGTVVGVKLSRHAEGEIWTRVSIGLADHTGQTADSIRAMVTLGSILSDRGDRDEASSWFDRALQAAKADGTVPAGAVAKLHNRKGTLFAKEGQHARAEAEYRKALELWRRAHGEEHPDVAAGRMNVGYALMLQGQYEEAEHAYRQALALQRRLLGPEHPGLANTLNALAGVLMQRDADPEDGRALYEEALSIRRRALGTSHPKVASTLYNLGRIESLAGHPDAARAYHTQALRIREKTLGETHPEVARSLISLALIDLRSGACDVARPAFQRVLKIQRERLGDDHPSTALGRLNLAAADECLEDYAAADAGYAAALHLWESTFGPTHTHLAAALNGLASSALAQQRHDDAEPFARRATTILENASERASRLAESQFLLAQALGERASTRTEARRLARSARDHHDDPDGIDAWLRIHPDRKVHQSSAGK